MPTLSQSLLKNFLGLCLALASLSSSLAHADRIALVRDPMESLDLRGSSVANAETEVFIGSFIWTRGQASERLARDSATALRRGKRVRIALDGALLRFCDTECRLQLRYLQGLGAEVHVYNGLQLANWRNLLRPWRLLRRGHDKIHLVDRKFAMLGSRNIWDNSFELDGLKLMDLDIAIQGESCLPDIAAYVEEYWKLTHPWKLPPLFERDRKRLAELLEPPKIASELAAELPGKWLDVGDRARFVWDARALEKDGTNHIDFLEAWFSKIPAKGRLSIASPWILLTPRTQRAFESLLANGTELEFFHNSRLQAEYIGGVRGFLDRTYPFVRGRKGIEVYFWNGLTLHYKAMTDGESSYVGAFNLGPQSESRNSETGLFVQDRAFAEVLEREFQALREGSDSLPDVDIDDYTRSCASLFAWGSSKVF
ncbi:phosphatidylserine/phosphatidylglycerophosphate/cardiolipin synthase family protein [bacterium]|nr:phosphatidylserine/phosphatidylglycerophosphate/cardiolipin synthase family protein [bacterium]